jgi:branched-chain amino acid transport system permease protein
MKLPHTAGLVLAVLALFALAPLVISSGFVLNLLIMTLLTTVMAQAWNLLGGFGGQLSFGHAAFFGTGAYAMAILQVHTGLNAWVALIVALALSAALGAIIGALAFRYGLRGSYFSLVTLAIAELLRILANAVPITGAGVGIQLPLNPDWTHLQFASKTGYLYFLLVFVAVGFLLSMWLKYSRYGAYLLATRDSEYSAQALGINVQRVKLYATTLSAFLMGVSGVFYVQYFQYIDPNIAYGPAYSVQALVAAVIGGTATVFGPLLGALALQILGELTRNLMGGAPGISLVIYGALLVIMVIFLPRGVASALKRRQAQ